MSTLQEPSRDGTTEAPSTIPLTVTKTSRGRCGPGNAGKIPITHPDPEMLTVPPGATASGCTVGAGRSLPVVAWAGTAPRTSGVTMATAKAAAR
jgi:hypothetical protein